jgi:hypothetical protein
MLAKLFNNALFQIEDNGLENQLFKTLHINSWEGKRYVPSDSVDDSLFPRTRLLLSSVLDATCSLSSLVGAGGARRTV